MLILTFSNVSGLCKNGICGFYHTVNSTHLLRYPNESSFRYNHRNDVAPMFFSFLKRAFVSQRAG
jgi:hypothetical protein